MKTNSLQEIGKYIYTNNSGFLKSDLSITQIQINWKPAVKEFADGIQNKFAKNIHSIFLRGSVATASAIEDVSDIDFFLIYKQLPTKDEKEDIALFANELNKKFPFITRFDIGYYLHEEIINLKEKALIKLTAICVSGTDLKNDIPELKPGRDIAVTLLGLEKEINLTLNQINTDFYNSENTLAMCIWMMKRLVRGGFELTAERSQKYTRDLYLCWQNFSVFYPEKSSSFYEALELAVNPTKDIQKIREVINKCGPWLISEAKSNGLA